MKRMRDSLRTTAEVHGSDTDTAARAMGMMLWSHIAQAADKGDALCRFIFAGRSLPLTKKVWFQIGALQEDDFEGERLSLDSPMRRHGGDIKGRLMIPNPWRGFDIKAIRTFLSAMRENASGNIANAFGISSTVSSDRYWIFRCLEATLMGRFPQAHIACANFLKDFAFPESMDFAASDYFYPLSRQHPIKRTTAISAVLGALKNVRERLSRYMQVIRLLRDAASTASMADMQIINAVIFLLTKARSVLVLKDGKWRLQKRTSPLARRIPFLRRRLRLSTVERYAREFGNVQSLLAKLPPGGSLPPLSRVTRRALTIFQASLSADDPEQEFDEEVDRKRSRPRPVVLVRPAAIRAYYGLDTTPPTGSNDLETMARRILACFLHYSGRRGSCLVLLQVRDIKVAKGIRGETVITARITESKTKASRGSSVPVSKQWPEREVDHLLAFLQRAEAMGVGKDRQLICLAGLGRKIPGRGGEATRENQDYDVHSLSAGQKALAGGLVEGRTVSTHLGRIFFATYWMLRIYCRANPSLREHPAIREAIGDHHWFSDEGNAQLDLLLGTHRAPAHEILRRLLGLASAEEIHVSYNRAIPLEMELWQAIHEVRSGKFWEREPS